MLHWHAKAWVLAKSTLFSFMPWRRWLWMSRRLAWSSAGVPPTWYFSACSAYTTKNKSYQGQQLCYCFTDMHERQCNQNFITSWKRIKPFTWSGLRGQGLSKLPRRRWSRQYLSIFFRENSRQRTKKRERQLFLQRKTLDDWPYWRCLDDPGEYTGHIAHMLYLHISQGGK